MKNGIFTLDWASVGDALITGVVSAVFVAAYGIVTAPGFDVFMVQWITVGHQMVNIAVIAAFVSLGKDFLSTNTGSLLGVGKPWTDPSQQG